MAEVDSRVSDTPDTGREDKTMTVELSEAEREALWEADAEWDSDRLARTTVVVERIITERLQAVEAERDHYRLQCVELRERLDRVLVSEFRAALGEATGGDQ